MNRRHFIKNMSALYLPIGIGIPGLSYSSIAPLLDNNPGKILVIIQLIGGYDGLSAFLPLDQYGNLSMVRSNILPSEKSLLKAGDKNAFHPALTGFQKLFDEGKMTVIQNVGYPLQNRSHFRSTDIWNSASSSTQYIDTGWLGRFSDLENTVETEYPWAISIGKNVAETCQGQSINHAISIIDPSAAVELPYGKIGDLGTGSFSNNMNYILETIAANNKYSNHLASTFDKGNTLSKFYSEDNSLAQQFKTIAQLIAGGLKTPIYTVTLGGFDTHANQISGTDKTQGILPNLLKTLGDAVYAFWDDLTLLGLEDKVMAMTYSEFGRKIRSNASLGTDHGDAAPMFLFGNCLNHQIKGENPVIHSDVSQKDGIPFEIDFRNVYGSVLENWFSYSAHDVQGIFNNHTYQNLNLTETCDTLSSDKNKNLTQDMVQIYPQPVRKRLVIDIPQLSSNSIQLILRDISGRSIQKWKYDVRGMSNFRKTLLLKEWPSGMYYMEINGKNIKVTKKVLIQH